MKIIFLHEYVYGGVWFTHVGVYIYVQVHIYACVPICEFICVAVHMYVPVCEGQRLTKWVH